MNLTKPELANPIRIIKKIDRNPIYRSVPLILALIGFISLILLPNKDSYNFVFKTSSSIAKSVKKASKENKLAGNIHIGQLTGLSTKSESQWIATVKVTVLESNNQPVENIEVTGFWNAGFKGVSSCVTDSSGSCLLITGKIDKEQSKVTFTLENLKVEDGRYVLANNKDDNRALNPVVIINRP